MIHAMKAPNAGIERMWLLLATLEKVVNRLCETIRHLSKNTIISITRRQWMWRIFNWK